MIKVAAKEGGALSPPLRTSEDQRGGPSMKNDISFMLFITFVVALSGCANVTAVPAPPGSNVSGIRVYDVKPILVVTDQETKVVLVPNYNRAYALQINSFLAKNDVDIELDTGMVKTIKSDQDTTAIIELFKTLADKIPTPLSGASHSATGAGATSRFAIYDFVFDDEGNLLGVRPLVTESQLGPRPKTVAIPAAIPPAPGGASPGPGTPEKR